MNRIQTSALEVAKRYIGMKEIPGTLNSSAIMAMLTLDNDWPKSDEVPWCSAFVNWIAWNLGIPRSGNLGARSWLNVGLHVEINDAQPGIDVVVLWRVSANSEYGHVGFFNDYLAGNVGLVGGNQSDRVNLTYFDKDRILAVRRLTK